MFVKEKIKINFIQGSYWLVPSIFTISKRKWVSHPYTDLNFLITKNNWTYTPLLINLNRDDNYIHYNNFQKVRGLKQFYINEEIIKVITEDKFYDFTFSENLVIRLDTKSIKTIRAGNIFSYPEFFFEMISKEKTKRNEKIVLLWRKNNFEEIKQE